VIRLRFTARRNGSYAPLWSLIECFRSINPPIWWRLATPMYADSQNNDVYVEFNSDSDAMQACLTCSC